MFQNLKRFYSSSFYISTPIFYVNSSPHIGHLYTALIADATQRFNKLLNPNINIIFSTGTDEHGLKIQNAAIKNNIKTIDFCNKISNQYKELFALYNIDYTHFVRTTNIDHYKAVNIFWNKLKQSDSIYKNTYKGWYCISEESFLLEHQIKPSENNSNQFVSIETGHPVEWIEEDNYMFKLNKYSEDVLYWLKQNENIIQPKKFYNQLINMCIDINNDISISRPKNRVHWGIPVPDDDDQTIYVWLDALINYLTINNYPNLTTWPPNIQILGKDILKFHGLYWPAFLIANNLELPKTLLVHSHWTVNGIKMSKSIGNVINPIDKLNDFKSCGLRYFLLREATNHSDSNYSETKAKNILNSELANTLGNLLNRCLSKNLNPNNIKPKLNKELYLNLLEKEILLHELITKTSTLHEDVKEHYDNFNFYKGIDQIIFILHLTNKFFDYMKPWIMKKENNINNLNLILSICLDILRICGIGLQPIVPELSNKLLTKLSIPNNERLWNNMKLNIEDLYEKEYRFNNENVILYQKIK